MFGIRKNARKAGAQDRSRAARTLSTMAERRTGKDRRTGEDRRKQKAPPPGGKDRRTGDDRRTGKDRRGGST
jgi:hypothetical protein